MGDRVSARTATIAGSAAVGWLGGLVFAWGGIDFALDDAWIHLSYAQSLKLAEGLSYNPNDWETGFSSPLWVLALTILPWFGKPMVAVKALGVFIHGVASGLAALGAMALAEGASDGSESVTDSWRAGVFAGLVVGGPESFFAGHLGAGHGQWLGAAEHARLRGIAHVDHP